nr:AraC family transcriptional regulator [uncultured Trichococcus sp.]
METAFFKTYFFNNQTDLKILFSGKATCESLHSFGPAVRPNYIIHIVTKGKGRYQLDNESYEVAVGQGFIIPPDTRTFYQADKEDPWSYYWIGFEGALAPFYLDALGCSGHHPVFQTENMERIIEIIEESFLWDQESLFAELMLSARLYEFLVLCKQTSENPVAKDQPRNPHIREAIAYIRSYYATPMTIQNLAEALCLNRSYLSSIFKQEMGVTLQQYLTDHRLTRAAELLGLNNFSIDEIAEYSGYRDTLVFSKAFKRKYAITPTAYRKTEYARQVQLKENAAHRI